MRQRQFLDVVDDATATQRVREACAHLQAQSERVPLADAWGRILHTELSAPVDVPGFDRSNVDGFALRAADTYGAQETEGRVLRLRPETLAAGRPELPEGFELGPGEAVAIATGAILPRGADAVVMVEDTAPLKSEASSPAGEAPNAAPQIVVFRAVAPGAWITGAGTDVGRGEVVLRRRQPLGSRETALAAAVGAAELEVFRRPRVAILSTGDEIRPPGATLQVGDIHDSNGRVLADAVRECGGEPLSLGIIGDDEVALRDALRSALEEADFILMSGGTSKGAGDLNHRVVAGLAREIEESPGILVHGVALKPGKPFCFARVGSCPVAILPGFPTSAIFTFHEFIAPELRRLSGTAQGAAPTVAARAPMRLPSAVGRTEYLLVDLVESEEGLAAYPLGKGSGSVSTFSAADGFLRIDRLVEYVEEGAELEIHPLGADVRRPDLLAIGSHCVGLDELLSRLADRGLTVKSIHVGSQGGLRALARGEGDVAGMHLLDEASGRYNAPFLAEDMEIIGGYGRRQGFVSRPGDERFAPLMTLAKSARLDELARRVQADDLVMVNRNRGSGTRIIIDKFLEGGGGARPRGYHADARSHHAVAAAVAQGRADWGITIEALARAQNLDFVFLCDERYDFVTRRARRDRPGVRALRALLEDESVRAALRELGFEA
jgi:molybdopterin molybdotransferase/putative molybdopterin biosynthesis protein